MEILLILNLTLSILGIFGIAFLYRQNQNNANNNATDPAQIKEQFSNIISQVVSSLSSNQFQFLGQILDQINQNNTLQNKVLSSSLAQLEQRFGELQVKIQTSLSDELNKIQTLQTETKANLMQSSQVLLKDVELSFEKIQQANQTSLNSLQANLQSQLVSGINNLLDISSRELKALQSTNNSNFELLSKTNQDRLLQIQAELDKRLSENLTQNLKSFETITQNLTQMQGMAQKMIDSTSSIDKLNNIFERTSGKAFGSFGEKYLENLLSEYINPKHWVSQGSVPGTSDKIDFIIQVGEQKIGIDSKFPATKYNDYLAADSTQKKQALNAFLKTVVGMGQSIYEKYNKANFLDTILIYLPSDSMFAEVVGDTKTVEALQKYRINPASPTTIVPILAMIRQYEFKLKVQDGAEEIMAGLKVVKKGVDSFKEEFKKLGDKMRQAQSNYDSAEKNLNLVHKTVDLLEAHSTEVIDVKASN